MISSTCCVTVYPRVIPHRWCRLEFTLLRLLHHGQLVSRPPALRYAGGWRLAKRDVRLIAFFRRKCHTGSSIRVSAFPHPFIPPAAKPPRTSLARSGANPATAHRSQNQTQRDEHGGSQSPRREREKGKKEKGLEALLNRKRRLCASINNKERRKERRDGVKK